MIPNRFLQLLILFIFVASVSAQIPKVSEGTIKHFENFDSKFVTARNIDVWLPSSYDENKKYSVLYMHDGASLFDPNLSWNQQEWGVDEVLSSLLKQERIRDCIVVAIWNSEATRQSEYCPQKVFESLTTEQQKMYYAAELFNTGNPILEGEIQSDNYLKFVVRELKPFIDKTFSVYKDRDHTFVAGSSYGGLISIYSICEYPNVFGKAICMSTHWPGILEPNTFIPKAIYKYLNSNLPDPKSHSIYFDYGTEEIDALYKPYQQKIDQIMISKGYDNKNWMTKEFEGGKHNQNSWGERLHLPLTFILKKD